jgi:hypothetical protein
MIRHASVPAAHAPPTCWIVLQVIARLRSFLVRFIPAEQLDSLLTALATKRLYEQECDIAPLKGPPLVSGSTLVPLILASFFFVARIISKSIGLAGGWGWDDYTIIVSYVCHFVVPPYYVNANGPAGPRSRHICSQYIQYACATSPSFYQKY